MNIVRWIAAFCHSRVLELLFLLSVALLVGQLSWPSVLHWWQLPSPGAIGIDQFESPTIASEYLIFLPKVYTRAHALPLVVFLHGNGDCGNDPNQLRDRWPLPLKFPAIVAVPQCLPSYSWDSEEVVRFVKHVALRYHVDGERIYLVGCSMGGFGVWQTAAIHPEMFAALVPISGGGDPKQASTQADIPVWAFHGARDKTVPVAETAKMIKALRSAGGHPIVTIIPDQGHGICQSVLNRDDLWQWLLQQRRVQ